MCNRRNKLGDFCNGDHSSDIPWVYAV